MTDNNDTTLSKRVDLIKSGGFVAGTNLVSTSVASVTCGANQILLDIRASGVNPVDWKMAEHGFLLAANGGPTALGCDVAGTIVAVSSSSSSDDDSSPWQVGQRVVTYLGADKSQSGITRPGYADTTVVDMDLVFSVPQGMTLPQAAAMPVGGITAFAMLDQVDEKINKNDENKDNKKDCWLLVWGASSSVGWSAIPLAVQQRGYKVIAVASAKHSARLAKLGAAAVVDYKDGAEKMLSQVKDILQGSALNAALDCIGTQDSFNGTAALVQACGDTAARTICTVNEQTTPEAPAGMTKTTVDMASLDKVRALVQTAMPVVLKYCQPPKLRLIHGNVSAETVEKAFQIQKKDVSGEKVVIEWKKE